MAEYTLSGCTAWKEQWVKCIFQVRYISVNNLVVKILQSPAYWRIIDKFINSIMREEEEHEWIRQGQSTYIAGDVASNSSIQCSKLVVTLTPRTILRWVGAFSEELRLDFNPAEGGNNPKTYPRIWKVRYNRMNNEDDGSWTTYSILDCAMYLYV